MFITPSNFAEFSAYDLLDAVSKGRIGLDHRLLHRLLDEPEKSAPDILRFALEDRGADPIKLDYELIAIFRHLGTPDALPFYLKVLRHDPVDVPEELVNAILPVREAALEPLLQLYEELDEEESGEIAFLLASFRSSDSRVLPILLERLEYDAGDGAICLGLHGDPAARPALEKLLEELPEEEAHLRQDVRDAVEQLGRVADQSVEPYDIWEEFPETASPEWDLLTEEELLDALNSPDPEYRKGAVNGLRVKDISDHARDLLFEHARTDESATVRGAAWRALSPEAEEREIRAAMLARLEDPSAPLEERAGALVGLGSEAEKQPVRKFAEEFYNYPESRAAAIGAMWRSLDRNFAKYVAPHVTDKDPEIRDEAILGVGYLCISEAAEELRKHFEDADVRSDALFAYALSVRHEISKGRMQTLLGEIEEAAGGFTGGEEDLVKMALDERLLLNGRDPVFFPERHEDRHAYELAKPTAEAPAAAAPAIASSAKIGRNEPCPCGSGKKYKKCCGAP